jgi:hypothetical protein
MVQQKRAVSIGEQAFVAVTMAALGAGCVVVPVMVSSKPLMDAPLFPLIRTAVESLSWAAPAALLVLGVIAGALTRWHPVAIGAASVAVFPVVAIAEIVKDPTSHNLIPFEMVMYAFLAVPAVLGAWVGGLVARLARARAEK